MLCLHLDLHTKRCPNSDRCTETFCSFCTYFVSTLGVDIEIRSHKWALPLHANKLYSADNVSWKWRLRLEYQRWCTKDKINFTVSLLLLSVFNKLQTIFVIQHSISCDAVWFKNLSTYFGQFILSTPWGTWMSANFLCEMKGLPHTPS